MMDELADQDLYRKAASRLADRSRAVEVDLDDYRAESQHWTK
jgi:antitoxin StbD